MLHKVNFKKCNWEEHCEQEAAISDFQKNRLCNSKYNSYNNIQNIVYCVIILQNPLMYKTKAS